MTVSRTDFLWDLFLGFLNLAIGRLLPKLHVPKTDLKDKIAIVTGGNSGIGFEIALELARRGATVHLACRNASKADFAVSHITSQVPDSHGRVKPQSLDTSSLSSVRAFEESWQTRSSQAGSIDILVHNAGVASVSQGQDVFTSEGFPLLYATNFLGSFLLTHLLERHLSTNARVISTTSTGQYGGNIDANFAIKSTTNRIEPDFHCPKMSVSDGKLPADGDVYNNTKLMQVAFTRLLQQHFDRKANERGQVNRKIAHCFTPGFTLTPMIGKLNIRSLQEDPVWWVLQTTAIFATHPQQGAATGVWLATTQDKVVVRAKEGGGYWERMVRRVSKAELMGPDVMQRLWVRWEADAGIEWR